MGANNNSPQSPPLNDQVPQQMRIGIEIPLDPVCGSQNYVLLR